MFSALIERAQEHKEHELDTLAEVGNIQFTEWGIEVPENLFRGTTAYPMTDWALQQACDKLGPPPFHYIHQCPPWLQAQNLDHWRDQLDTSKKWLIRAYDDRCRAILSQEYCPIGNEQMLQWLDEYVEGAGSLVQCHLDPDTLHIKLIFVNKNYGSKKGGEYGFGVYVGNGEIGNRRVRALPLIQIGRCSNSIIIAEGGYSQVHRFRTIKFVEASVRQALIDGLRVATESIEQVWQAAIDEMPKFTDVVEAICKVKGLSPETKARIYMGTEGAQTRMGLVNGLTYAAQGVDSIELRIDMETWAGAILVNPNSLFGHVGLQLADIEAEQEG